MAVTAAALGLARRASSKQALVLTTAARPSVSLAPNPAAVAAAAVRRAMDISGLQAVRRHGSAGSLEGSASSDLRSLGVKMEGYMPLTGAGRLPMSRRSVQRLLVEDLAADCNPLL